MLTADPHSKAVHVSRIVSTLKENIHSLSQALTAETHRRHGKLPELTNKLPGDVVRILLLMDGQEEQGSKESVSTHKRYVEVGEKLIGRIVAEEDKFQERMQELKVREQGREGIGCG